MILFGLDTEKKPDRDPLWDKIFALTMEEAVKAQAEADRQTDKILAEGRALSVYEKSALNRLRLQVELRKEEAALAEQRRLRDQARQALEQPQPQPQPGSWEELKAFADTFPRREAGQQSHPVLAHLRQRLGASQATRPQVRARLVSTGRVEPVTKANFQALLTAAIQRPWGLLTQAYVNKLAEHVTVMKPTIDPRYRRALDESALWSKVLVFSGDKDDQGKPDKGENYRREFEKAWTSIVELVDGEVLDLVGLPDVRVYTAEAGIFGSRPAFYDERIKTIFFKSACVAAERIRHEFGHHIEDQGPVEIWFGLASMLNWLSEGRPLNPSEEGSTREPTYAINLDVGGYVGVTKLPYTASYYADAGTEVLSTSLEDDVLGNLADYIDWPADMRSQPARPAGRLGNCRCGPELAYLLLHALRPGEMRDAGFASPALL